MADKCKPPDPPDIPYPSTPPNFTLHQQPNPLSQLTDVVCSLADSDRMQITSRKRPVMDELPNQTRPSKQLKSQISRERYSSNDKSPFIVHVTRVETNQNDGTILHPVTFGLFLLKNNVSNIVQDGVKKIGRNRVSVEFNSHQDANSFLSNSLLNKAKYSASIPSFNITRMGVVSGVPVDMSEEDAMIYITVPIGCGKILKVRRINRKSFKDGIPEWKATETCVITFDGQVLPKRVFCCYNSLPVEQYIYPTIQCYECCRFGHVESICRSKPRCFKCGHDHQGNGCDFQEKDAFCILCSGNHFANSKSCPEFGRQRTIKSMMAEKVLSYAEASKSVPSVSRSYANVTKSMPSSTLTQSYKKTVYLNPKTHAPLAPSYDKFSHHNIVKSPQSTQPNGCALDSINAQHSSNPSEIIHLLIQLLTSFMSNNTSQSGLVMPSASQSPYNDADRLATLLLNYKNGSTGVPPMECEERVS